MIRVKQNTPTSISNTWYESGNLLDPGTVTLTLTAADGTELISDATASGSGAAARTYNLTTAHTANLDRLTATWTSPAYGSDTEIVEIVGDFLFTVNQARLLDPLTSTTKYSTARIVEARTLAEQTIEDACERAFVPRYRRETLDGSGSPTLLLGRPDLRRIRSVTGDGSTWTNTQLTQIGLRPSGVAYSSGGWWPRGIGNVTVGYEHGLDYPPARVSQAALILARSWLVKGPVDERALGQATAGGDFSFGLATPGRNGSWVGIPEVDAVIDQYNLRTGVA